MAALSILWGPYVDGPFELCVLKTQIAQTMQASGFRQEQRHAQDPTNLMLAWSFSASKVASGDASGLGFDGTVLGIPLFPIAPGLQVDQEQLGPEV